MSLVHINYHSLSALEEFRDKVFSACQKQVEISADVEHTSLFD